MNQPVRRLVLLATCASILFVGKIILIFIPNIEVVTFFLIVFTIVFSLKEALFISTVYTIVEIQLWSLSEQAYIWTLIVLMTFLVKNVFKQNFMLWAFYAGFFGLLFGTLSSIPLYIFYRFSTTSIVANATIGGYILSGLPFDALHMVGNYFIMLFFGEIVYKKLQILLKYYYNDI